MTGQSRRTVERALNRLLLVRDDATGETAALVCKDGAIYTALDVDLDAVARLLHVDGEGQRQRERHERERERHSFSWQEERRRRRNDTLPARQPRPKKAERLSNDASEREKFSAVHDATFVEPRRRRKTAVGEAKP